MVELRGGMIIHHSTEDERDEILSALRNSGFSVPSLMRSYDYCVRICFDGKIRVGDLASYKEETRVGGDYEGYEIYEFPEVFCGRTVTKEDLAEMF